MSDKKEQSNKENKSSEKKKNGNVVPNFVKNNTNITFRTVKRVSKNLMSLAKDEILDIKNSKKGINIAKYESHKEYLAPSNYSINKKEAHASSFKNYDPKFESVEEKKINNKNKEEDEKKDNNEKNKDEVSSSDISDDEDN